MANHFDPGGLLTAMATPFDRNLEIDKNSWLRLLDRQLEGNVDGVVICGTTGESPTITDSEFEYLVTSAKERIGHRCRLWVGTGTNVTAKTVHRSQKAEQLGADGLLLVTPYYNKPTQQGLQQHFQTVADAVSIPAMIYNVPGRTGTLIQPETTGALSHHPNIVASKEATGNIGQITDTISRVADDFSVLAGDDTMTLPAIACGGRGVVSVIGNIVPGEMKKFTDSALNNEMNQARKQLMHLWPLIQLSTAESNPIPIKAALGMAGIIDPHLRPPLTPLSDHHHPNLKQVLTELNLIP